MLASGPVCPASSPTKNSPSARRSSFSSTTGSNIPPKARLPQRAHDALPSPRAGSAPPGSHRAPPVTQSRRRDVSGSASDDATTRSEEQLRVGTASPERGRLRKYVVTEEVQHTVPVRREEVRVEREPVIDSNVDRPTDGPAISDEEHEMVLYEEEVVTEKRVVPKERIRLTKDTVTGEQQVADEVRKEQIDVDTGPA